MTLVFAGFQLSIVRVDPEANPDTLERIAEAQRIEDHIEEARLKALRTAMTAALGRFL